MPASCAPVLRAEDRPVYGESGFERVRTVYALRSNATDAQRQQARDSLIAALEPCGAEFAKREITRLHGLTKMREGTGASLSGAAYVAEIAAYPADAVSIACRLLAGKQTFFPSWAELRRELEIVTEPLRDALKALDGERKPGLSTAAEASRAALEKAQSDNLARIMAKHGAEK